MKVSFDNDFLLNVAKKMATIDVAGLSLPKEEKEKLSKELVDLYFEREKEDNDIEFSGIGDVNAANQRQEIGWRYFYKSRELIHRYRGMTDEEFTKFVERFNEISK